MSSVRPRPTHRRWRGRPPRFPLTSSAGKKKEGGEAIADAIKAAEDSVQDGSRPEINSELFFAAPVPTLVDLSKEAQMMAVGCRGQEALQRALLGSVSTGLVHHAHCPVAMIHDEAPILLQPSQLPVLVGIDGSPASELATAIAFDEASFRGVELVALHAWIDQDMTTVPGMDPSALKSAAETTLAERLAGFQARYPDVAVRRAVVFEHPARHAAAREEETRILTRRALAGLRVADVMTAHPHTAPAGITVEDFIQQYLLGDATRRIRLRTVTGRWLG